MAGVEQGDCNMAPDELPRQLGEDDELPDFGSRIGDTLTFGSGSYIRAISADEARRQFPPRKLTDLGASDIDKALAFAKGYMTATRELGPEPGSVLDSRPRRRGLNRLIPTGRRRAARKRTPAPAVPPRPPVVVPPVRLTVELVPKTSWYHNVRALVDEMTWDRIRHQVWRQAEYRCEICGGRGPEHPVECHEVWRYDDRTRVQALVRMIALCPACHQVKHLGLANVQGRARRPGRTWPGSTAGRLRGLTPTSMRRLGCGRSAARDRGRWTWGAYARTCWAASTPTSLAGSRTRLSDAPPNGRKSKGLPD
jgi:hypothetical protein